jgi:hypothetical protein
MGRLPYALCLILRSSREQLILSMMTGMLTGRAAVLKGAPYVHSSPDSQS